MTGNITGTIIKGVAGQYTIATASGTYICNARGLFRKNKIKPIIGDKVAIITAENNNSEKNNENSTGTIAEILPRTNALNRPKVANVDCIIITLAAAKPPLHFTMLDRYLMQAEYEQINAAICINKIDLNSEIPQLVQEIYATAGYPIFAVSAENQLNLAAVAQFVTAKITVLAGPSGVGKTSLINTLTNKTLQTGTLSEKIDRGKHTTRHTEFFPLPQGGYIIDTPGFSSLDPPNLPKLERATLFREFNGLLGQCRFSDCLHVSEQDCAIKNQVGKTINPRRYESYLELVKNP
ncbi:MAG: ribosome small subunit-dependent GTPase A [Defluviitaleaceae bacterium]|nr:ribosome small subunit-dependent GTPase A [Defluviitaleaceae bacterium]